MKIKPLDSMRIQVASAVGNLNGKIPAVLGLLVFLTALEMLLHSRGVALRIRHEGARQELALLQNNQDLLARIALQRAQQSRRRDSLLTLTNQSLKKHQLHSNALTPNSDGSMTLSFDATEYVQLMTWLHAMERQEIRIIDIGIAQTGTPGLVNARLTLAQ